MHDRSETVIVHGMSCAIPPRNNKAGIRLAPRHHTLHYPMPHGVCLTAPKCILSCVLEFHLPYPVLCHLIPCDTTWKRSVHPDFWPTRGVSGGGGGWSGISGFLAHMPEKAFSSHRSVY
jgi:hypothetical protein